MKSHTCTKKTKFPQYIPCRTNTTESMQHALNMTVEEIMTGFDAPDDAEAALRALVDYVGANEAQKTAHGAGFDELYAGLETQFLADAHAEQRENALIAARLAMVAHKVRK